MIRMSDPRTSNIVGIGQVDYMILGEHGNLLLDEIITVIDDRTAVIRILCNEPLESLDITAADIQGLNSNLIVAPGSIIITPAADYICFDVVDGISKFEEKVIA